MTDSFTGVAGKGKAPLNTAESAAKPFAGRAYRLRNVNEDNKKIPLPLLKNIGVNDRDVKSLQRSGYKTVEDLCGRDLSPEEYVTMFPAKEYLSVSVVTHFRKTVDSQSKNARISILRRGAGATLQEIGDELEISRERVRQIIVKSCRRLKSAAELIAGVLFSTFSGVFTYSDLRAFVAGEEIALCCKLALKESDYVRQFDFSDKFVLAGLSPPDPERLLAELVRGCIGECANFHDDSARLESGLKGLSLWFFDLEDLKSYLIRERYYFYGDYVTKGKQPYASVCYDAIRKYYPFDIKLDDDENNDDMKQLRVIIAEHYQGLNLPPSNKAMTSAITRDSAKMVLSGRGRYCPFEKVDINESLFMDVYNFIISKRQTTFYYSELFDHFRNRLLAETNVHNYNFLHGILKCIYPDEFIYERDMLIKKDALRVDFNHRLSLLLKQRGCAMSTSEIRQTIRGINGFVITCAAIRLPEILKWDYNEFNHIENLSIKPDDLSDLENIIETQLGEHSGYCSDTLLYAAARQRLRKFMETNRIKNARNLFYVADHLFSDRYRFRKPHIVAADFPVRELSVANIARGLLKSGGALNHHEYHTLAKSLGWAGGTLHAVFYELKKDYIRVSENDYVRKEYFVLPEETKNALTLVLGEKVKSTGFCALAGIRDYETFPQCGYQWNGFLLESLIAEFGFGFRVISPRVKDRRFHKGLIVPENSRYNSFEELVAGLMKDNGYNAIDKAGMTRFLREQGIINNRLPRELYECDGIRFRNEAFIVKE